MEVGERGVEVGEGGVMVGEVSRRVVDSARERNSGWNGERGIW